MDDIDLADRIKRLVATEKKNISDTMMDGLLKDVEHYRNLQGQIHALNLVELEIANYFKDNK
jgi:hypothetical protein|tara:strand:- start:378 stop:563 length:186 start_codon:yes stop_codon:yes gene_type:complete